MADIIGLAAGAAGGGVSRSIAKVTGRIAGPFERRQENAQEQARWKHEAALMELQMKARASELGGGEQESLAQPAGAWPELSASKAAEASIGDSRRWGNAVRALTRPRLTSRLWLVTSLVWFVAAATARSRIVETAALAVTAANSGGSETGETGARCVEPFLKHARNSRKREAACLQWKRSGASRRRCSAAIMPARSATGIRRMR
jgi:hypothetical protein